MELLIHSKIWTATQLKFGNGQLSSFYDECIYLSMLDLKLIHASKKDPYSFIWFVRCCI